MMHRADMIAEVTDDASCETQASAWCVGVPDGNADEDCHPTLRDCNDFRAATKPACVEVH